MITLGLFPAACLRPALAAAPPAATLSVPFVYDPLTDPYIIIQVSVNHHRPLPFIADTGLDTPLIIEPWAARQLGVRPSGRTLLVKTGASASKVRRRAQVDRGYEDVRLVGTGASAAIRLQSIVMETGDITDDTIAPIAGLVGLPMLQGWCLQIDFPRRLLLFSDTAAGLPQRAGAAFPLRLDTDGDLDIVLMPFGSGAGDTHMFLDTGAPTASLPDFLIPSLHPSEGSAAYDRTLAGTADTVSWTIPHLPVGPLTVPAVEVYGTPSSLGTLGLSVLSRFVVTLDWPHKKMILAAP